MPVDAAGNPRAAPEPVPGIVPLDLHHRRTLRDVHHARVRSRPILACLAVLALAGCIVLPIPQGEGEVTEGREITPERAASVELGRTSRAEVLERLGEPTAIWLDRRVFVYAWDRVHLKVLWIAAARYTAAGGLEDVPTHYVLLLQFDETDHVVRAERCVRPLLSEYGAFLAEWADGKSCR